MSTNNESKQTCPDCGNNPVNHTFIYINESINVFLQPIFEKLLPFQNKQLDTISNKILAPFPWLFKKLGLLTMNRDPEKARSDRSRVIWDEAIKRGIEMEGMLFLGKPIEYYRAKINGTWKTFESLPIPERFDRSAYKWLDDKGKLKNFLQKHKIPVGFGKNVKNIQEALDIFQKGTAPYITKPRLGSRGRHTTTHIYTKEELIKGFNSAKQICPHVIVEEHLIGSVYRGTYVVGEVVGILRGDPPRVTGNGKLTIEELIQHKNKNKHKKVKDVKISPKMLHFLKRQNLTLKTVLQKGRTIDLSEKIGISYGGFPAEDFPRTHPKIIEYIKKAGDALNAPVVGFDFIIADITKDPDLQKWGIIEANSLPFIDLHHFPLEGEPINVAAKIWDLWK